MVNVPSQERAPTAIAPHPTPQLLLLTSGNGYYVMFLVRRFDGNRWRGGAAAVGEWRDCRLDERCGTGLELQVWKLFCWLGLGSNRGRQAGLAWSDLDWSDR